MCAIRNVDRSTEVGVGNRSRRSIDFSQLIPRSTRIFREYISGSGVGGSAVLTVGSDYDVVTIHGHGKTKVIVSSRIGC